MKQRIISIVAALALCLTLLPIWAFATVENGAVTIDKLDLSNATATDANWETQGYKWEVKINDDQEITSGTLTLAAGFNAITVILPDAEVTVVTQGNYKIGTLTTGKAQSGSTNIQLTFSGKGNLTITEHIELSGGDHNSLTVAEGATVTVNNGISIGSSGGINSTVTVNGTLTIKQDSEASAIYPAIYAGKVSVGPTGVLVVSGKRGVQLNGMTAETGSGYDYTGVFTVAEDGSFSADCMEYNILVTSPAGTFPEGSNSDKAFNIPEGYLPLDCEIVEGAGAVNLIRTDTNEIYTGPLTIHNHGEWKWGYDGTSHWRECSNSKKCEIGIEAHTTETPCKVCGYPPRPSGGSSGGSNCPSRAFEDLDTRKWYHKAVDYVLQNDLMGGYGNGLFGPNDPLTRAQFAQILYNREGKPAVTGGSTFTDVVSGAWYTPAVTWAAAQNVVVGYGDGTFGPDDSITREQLALMLWRHAGRPASVQKELTFVDADSISGYALEALQWAVERGILQGKGDGILDPKGNATRAEVAAMFMRYLSK